MSDFKSRKFKIIVITAYFNIFQLKPIVKTDNIRDFTKIFSFSLFRVEICSSKFQIGDSFSHFPYHAQLAIVLALRHAYLIPVLSGEQTIALFKSLAVICAPECYTHAPIISGIYHFKW